MNVVLVVSRGSAVSLVCQGNGDLQVHRVKKDGKEMLDYRDRADRRERRGFRVKPVLRVSKELQV